MGKIMTILPFSMEFHCAAMIERACDTAVFLNKSSKGMLKAARSGYESRESTIPQAHEMYTRSAPREAIIFDPRDRQTNHVQF